MSTNVVQGSVISKTMAEHQPQGLTMHYSKIYSGHKNTNME